MEAAVRADRRRFNRTARLAAWVVSHIAHGVLLAIQTAMGSADAAGTLKKFTSDSLLEVVPGYDSSTERPPDE